jgi:DNA (cytosine-5)-methyltransferase 1
LFSINRWGNMFRFAEFFAGAGMVRAALSPTWELVLANDIDPKKCQSYSENWGDHALIMGDIATLDPKTLYQPIDLYWASSPCQDLSLAGLGKGLNGARSGVFYHWINLVRQASQRGFAPRILAFENVRGLVTRNAGTDFIAVLQAFHAVGYRFGALEVDARHFLPQSRPRVFVIAVRADVELPESCTSAVPQEPFHTPHLKAIVAALPDRLRSDWVWWKLPSPTSRALALSDILSEGGDWFSEDKVSHLYSIMDGASFERIVHFCTIYKRGRPDEAGSVRQRAEVRFDGLAGCLRTPAGGSSKQTVVFVDDGKVRMRLLTPREALRLMGVDDSYRLPPSYNDGYKLAGDGVAVPVVAYLKTHILEPVAACGLKRVAA